MGKRCSNGNATGTQVTEAKAPSSPFICHTLGNQGYQTTCFCGTMYVFVYKKCLTLSLFLLALHQHLWFWKTQGLACAPAHILLLYGPSISKKLSWRRDELKASSSSKDMKLYTPYISASVTYCEQQEGPDMEDGKWKQATQPDNEKQAHGLGVEHLR